VYDSITVEEEPGMEDAQDSVEKAESTDSSFSEATDEDQIIDDGLDVDELDEAQMR